MKKFRYFLIISMSILVCLLSTGCNKNNTITNKIDNSLNALNTIIKKTEEISSDELVISEIMNKNEVAIYISIPKSQRQIVTYDDKTGYNGATFTSGTNYIKKDKYYTLSNYINKLELLHNVACKTITTNDNIKHLKSTLKSRGCALKSINNQVKNKEIALNQNQILAIKDILKTLNQNINKIKFSEKELTNEYKNVKNLKNNYANQIEQINIKYTKLNNCLENKKLLYSNCLGCVDCIYNCILNGTKSAEDLINYYKYINNNNENSYKDNKIDNDENLTDDKQIKETFLNKNKRKKEIKHDVLNNEFNKYGIYNGNGYAGYWGDFYYPRNINTFFGLKNIDTFGDYLNDNYDVDKIISNIDTFKTKLKEKKNKDISNKNDPNKLLPSSLNKKSNSNINNNIIDKNINNIEYNELVLNKENDKNKGFFRVYEISNGKTITNEIINFEDIDEDEKKQIKSS